MQKCIKISTKFFSSRKNEVLFPKLVPKQFFSCFLKFLIDNLYMRTNIFTNKTFYEIHRINKLNCIDVNNKINANKIIKLNLIGGKHE